MATIGFDMVNTLAWYQDNQAEIMRRLPPQREDCVMRLEIALRDIGRPAHLSIADVNSLLNAFPASAISRMALNSIVMGGSLWFHRDSVPGKPKPTRNAEEALSLTAIIPSMITYPIDPMSWWGNGGEITLFAVPDSLANKNVRHIIYLEGLAHECAHAIVTGELQTDCRFRFPDDHEVEALQFFAELSDVVNEHPPISHYAGAYTGPDGKLLDGLLPLNEALAECIAARLLGFSYRADGTGLEPFKNREKLLTMVDTYLSLTRIV